MFIEFDEMPDHARTWIFLAGKEISNRDRTVVETRLKEFTLQWEAHGQPLCASFKIVENQFIVLAVDEALNDISGCSIDSSVHVIKEIENKTGIEFFNRNLVPFQMPDGIVLISLGELIQKFAAGVWNGRTNTFNILANTVGAFRSNWIVPAEKTWLKRYMKVGSHNSVAG